MNNQNNNLNQLRNLTPHTEYLSNRQISNFNQSFQTNSPMIERPNFKNKNNVIHNNIGESVYSDHITEYTIHIDSVDRDATMYVNQFKFNVHFDDVTKPNISRRFSNIKYIRLENVILPAIYKIDTLMSDPSGTNVDASGNVISSDPNYIMENQRYLLLKMRELSNDRVYSTGNIVKSDTIKIYFDVKLNNYYNSWTTNQNSFVFTNGNLGNVKRLSFELYDSYGNIVLFQSNPNLNVPTSNLTNPYNKYNQMAITLIFGVVENEINTNPNFEK